VEVSRAVLGVGVDGEDVEEVEAFPLGEEDAGEGRLQSCLGLYHGALWSCVVLYVSNGENDWSRRSIPALSISENRTIQNIPTEYTRLALGKQNRWRAIVS
jgi:hypothetical protein